MSSNEAYHEPGAGGDGPGESAGGSGGGSQRSSHLHHQQILNETTYLKPAAKQAYFSDEKVLIPDDDRTNVSLLENR